MQDRAVAIVAIVAGSVVVLGLLTLVGLLVANGHGSEALLGLLGVVVAAYMQQIHSKVAAVEKATTTTTPPADQPEAKRTS